MHPYQPWARDAALERRALLAGLPPMVAVLDTATSSAAAVQVPAALTGGMGVHDGHADAMVAYVHEVAPEAVVIAYDCSGPVGINPLAVERAARLVVALEQATRWPIAVEMSFAGTIPFPAVTRAVRMLAAADIPVAAGAGNDSTSLDIRPVYPASYRTWTLLACAAADPTGNLYGYSNWGLCVPVAATLPDWTGGTSRAAAHGAADLARVRASCGIGGTVAVQVVRALARPAAGLAGRIDGGLID